MIRGKYWPILSEKIVEGSIIALKNSFRLYTESNLLLKNGHYSTALSIATLAIEEFGKHCLLMEERFSNNKGTINEKSWHDEFENHKAKLMAISRYLKKFSKVDLLEAKQQFEEFETYLLELAEQKIKALYVDWDGKNNDWFYYDDLNENKKIEAEKAVEFSKWMIEKYIEALEGDRDLVFTTPMEIAKLLIDRKIHGFCKKCSRVLITVGDFRAHNKICGNILSWYWNPKS